MEARIYFNKKSVINRLKKYNFDIEENKSNLTLDFGNGSISWKANEPKLAFLKITNYLELKNLPIYLKGLKIVKISLFETLLKEENDHIKQGEGKEGKSNWCISYSDKDFSVVSPTSTSYGFAYKSIITIRILGNDMQSIIDCYNKIRKGEMKNNWKGTINVPSHCGLMQQEEQYC